VPLFCLLSHLCLRYIAVLGGNTNLDRDKHNDLLK